MFFHHLSKFDKFSLKFGGEMIVQSWLLLTPFFSLTIVQWVDGFSWRYSTRCLSGVGTMIHLPCTVWLIGIHFRYVSIILKGWGLLADRYGLPLEIIGRLYAVRSANNQCNFVSTWPANLRTHMNQHSGEKLNRCSQCDYASFGTGNSRKHLKTDNRKRSNKCSQCEFSSVHAKSLRLHLIKHSALWVLPFSKAHF